MTGLLAGAVRVLRRQRQLHGWSGLVRRVPHYLSGFGRWRAALRAEVVPVREAGDVSRPRRLHPDLQPAQPDLPTTVSVVVPTLNAGPEFDLLLAKLQQQRGVPAIEVVVVDSGSTDATVAIARRRGAQLVELAPGEFSHSHARNRGAAAASGEHLLFIVQDAYPVGDRWVEGLLRGLLDRRHEGVVAVSSAEASRLDSELFYDLNAATHYAFLGCDHHDRVGRLDGEDHVSLRRMGQLSDVTCLIPRAVFERYGYRGDYAEDIDLGVRLIRDGHCVAMLASVKVLHSHHRPAMYYLKRGFVDLVFLRSQMADFPVPACPSIAGALRAAEALALRVDAWRQRVLTGAGDRDIARYMRDWLDGRPFDLARDGAPAPPAGASDVALLDFIAAFRDDGRLPDATLSERSHRLLADDLQARCRHLQHGVEQVHAAADARVRREVADVAIKALGAALGAALAGAWWASRERDAHDPERRCAERVYARLKAGV